MFNAVITQVMNGAPVAHAKPVPATPLTLKDKQTQSRRNFCAPLGSQDVLLITIVKTTHNATILAC